ncbi:hypothetical protein EYR40_000400 [Pleurotus pulmonarius]|nr:hypothetical protein EYR40_000400 [Pleurotus pulmonarius]
MFPPLLLASLFAPSLASALYLRHGQNFLTPGRMGSIAADELLPLTPLEGVRIHPNFNNRKCVTVRGGVKAEGTPVIIFDCNGSASQNWIINDADTKVQWAGTNWCLTGGRSPGNNVRARITKCTDGAVGQDWYYTADLRVNLAGRGQCLDLINGNLDNSNGVQTSGTSTSSSVAPTTSLPPNEAGVQIHPNFRSNKCLDVRGNILANGTPVQIYDCNGTGAQKWAIVRGQTHVRVAGTNFCLDAGSRPGNGVGMKIWTCYDNLPAQEWYYTGDNRIALFNKGLCLDLTDGNLSNSRQTQTWKCTDYNTNQIWNV